MNRIPAELVSLYALHHRRMKFIAAFIGAYAGAFIGCCALVLR